MLHVITGADGGARKAADRLVHRHPQNPPLAPRLRADALPAHVRLRHRLEAVLVVGALWSHTATTLRVALLDDKVRILRHTRQGGSPSRSNPEAFKVIVGRLARQSRNFF